jgi:hypothetical protein
MGFRQAPYVSRVFRVWEQMNRVEVLLKANRSAWWMRMMLSCKAALHQQDRIASWKPTLEILHMVVRLLGMRSIGNSAPIQRMRKNLLAYEQARVQVHMIVVRRLKAWTGSPALSKYR